MNERIQVIIEFEHISEKNRSEKEMTDHIDQWAHIQKGYFERTSNSYRITKIAVAVK